MQIIPREHRQRPDSAAWLGRCSNIHKQLPDGMCSIRMLSGGTAQTHQNRIEYFAADWTNEESTLILLFTQQHTLT